MEDLFAALTADLAAWVEACTGAPVAPEAFRLPREEGQLSLGTFVRGGAAEAARKLNGALCPQVREVRARNGWLLFFLSDAWFDGLITWARGLDTRPAGSYLENRMAMLARKGDGPCPEAEPVRRALWRAVGKPLRRRGGSHIETERKSVKSTFVTPAVCAFTADRRGNFAGRTGKTTERE